MICHRIPSQLLIGGLFHPLFSLLLESDYGTGSGWPLMEIIWRIDWEAERITVCTVYVCHQQISSLVKTSLM